MTTRVEIEGETILIANRGVSFTKIEGGRSLGAQDWGDGGTVRYGFRLPLFDTIHRCSEDPVTVSAEHPVANIDIEGKTARVTFEESSPLSLKDWF